MKRAFGALFVSASVLVPVASFAADTAAALQNLLGHRCNAPGVIGILVFEPIQRAGEIAKQQMPAIDEMAALNAKAKDPNRPLDAQLSKADIARFSEVRQRMMAMQLASLMESRRERDLRVILQLVQLADKNYRWGEKLGEQDPNYILQALLDLWELMADGRKWDTLIKAPQTTTCSLDRALYSVQQEADGKLGKIDLNRTSAALESIAKKYGKPINRTRLSAADRAVYDSAMDDINGAKREVRFMLDLERIKLMARASEIIYEADKQDVMFSGGRMESIGNTLAERVKANAFDEQTQFALGMWRKINEKIPARAVVREWEDIPKAAK